MDKILLHHDHMRDANAPITARIGDQWTEGLVASLCGCLPQITINHNKLLIAPFHAHAPRGANPSSTCIR